MSDYPLVAQAVKNPPAMQKTLVPSLGQEDPLEKGMTSHSSILAWRIPWTEELAGYSSWGHKEIATPQQLTQLKQGSVKNVCTCFMGCLVTQTVKNMPAVQEIWVRFLD